MTEKRTLRELYAKMQLCERSRQNEKVGNSLICRLKMLDQKYPFESLLIKWGLILAISLMFSCQIEQAAHWICTYIR